MIYEKLLRIQQELVATKDLYNSFGKYSYRSCESILESLKPLLAREKCIVLFKDEMHDVGSRNYIKVTLSFIDAETGESVEVTSEAREDETKKGMDGSQITGASSSYARKYALNAMFAIDDNKDSDETNTGEPKLYDRNEVAKKGKPTSDEWIDPKDIDTVVDYRKESINKWKEIGRNPVDLQNYFTVTTATTNEEWKKIFTDISAGNIKEL